MVYKNYSYSIVYNYRTGIDIIDSKNNYCESVFKNDS